MPMVNNRNPQFCQNIFLSQTNLGKTTQRHGDVRQDKMRISPARTASPQPALPPTEPRAQSMNTPAPRSQTSSALKEKTQQLTLWVKPTVKAELQRVAHQEGLSVSATGGALLEKSLQQTIDMHYGALLRPIIEQTIAREMRTISTRLAWLLVRVAFDSGQTRSLVTNILGRQPGVTPEVLKTILEGSGKTAKANITRRTPQITELIETVEQWLVAGDTEETGGGERRS